MSSSVLSSSAAMQEEVRTSYADSLALLTINSRPVIMSLTELADEYGKANFGPTILRTIEERMRQVPADKKLPCLYLMDSIVKNHPVPYKELFQKGLVANFRHVFSSLHDAAPRMAMYKLRQTWNEVFSHAVLHQLDATVRRDLDPKWPVTGQAPPSSSSVAANIIPSSPTTATARTATNIHINPAVFNKQPEDEAAIMARELKEKELELMKLRKMKMDIELENERKAIEEVTKAREQPASSTTKAVNKIVVTQVPKAHSSSRVTSSISRPPTSSSSSSESGHRSSRDPRSKPSTSIVDKKMLLNVNNISVKREKSPATAAAAVKEVTTTKRRPEASSSALPQAKAGDKSSNPPPKLLSKDDPKTNRPSSSSSSNIRKRPQQSEDRHDRAMVSTSTSSTTASSSPSVKQRKLDKGSSRSPGISDGGSSSRSPSPQPPPLISEERKKGFRIPKKPAAGDGESAGFTEEGPHMEFNKGKRLVASSSSRAAADGNRKRGGERTSPSDKKTKLNINLFGDDSSTRDRVTRKKVLPSPTVGWAKFKESNPDEFRTPLQDSADQDFGNDQQQHFEQNPFFGGDRGGSYRGGGGGAGRLGQKGRRMISPRDAARGSGRQIRFLPGPFANPEMPQAVGGGPPRQQQQQQHIMNLSPFGGLFHHVSDSDPHIVETQIIPQIVSQAKEGLRDGRINQEQFSVLMRQVMVLHEQAMIRQADRRHLMENNKENHSSSSSSGPWGTTGLMPPPPPIGGGMQQQQHGMPPMMIPPMTRQFPPGGPPFGPPLPAGGGVGAVQEGSSRFFNRDLPAANPEDLELIKNDPIKTINIDNHPRDIRFYGDAATLVMSENDVRELSFQRNPQHPMRRVFLDDNPNAIPPLELDVKSYTDFFLDGVAHKIKIGAPTRELWVDGQWYECYFDKQIRIRIGQNFHSFFMEGPPPNVKIGEQRRDLCAGFVHMIVDGDPNCQRLVFLDSKSQLLEIEGKPHVLRFVEGLRTLLINGHPFRTDFGGMPFVVYVNGNKHYLRLTSLPQGVKGGQVKIWNMAPRDGRSQQTSADMKPLSPSSEASQDHQSNGSDPEGGQSSSAFDRLLRLFPASSDGAKRDADTHSESDYSVKPEPEVQQQQQQPGAKAAAAGPPAVATPTDVHDLWTQLLGAGLVNAPGAAASGSSNAAVARSIPGLDSVPAAADSAKSETKTMQQQREASAKLSDKAGGEEKASTNAHNIAIELIVLKSHHKSIKLRQQGIITQLYDPSALQCKNCGLRYLSSDMIAYSQHLDWHFRMKRREKENAKRAQSQKWYFETVDWIISEEIEDEEAPADGADAKSTDRGTPSPSAIPTVPVSDNGKETGEGVCPICKEEFDQFYKEDGSNDDDDGRWHYRNAIRPPAEEGEDEEDCKNLVYHPQCYQDRKANAANATLLMEESMEEEKEEEAAVAAEAAAEDKEQGGPEEVVSVKEEVVETTLETTTEEPLSPIPVPQMATAETPVEVKREVEEEAEEKMDVGETTAENVAVPSTETSSSTSIVKQEEAEEETPEEPSVGGEGASETAETVASVDETQELSEVMTTDGDNVGGDSVVKSEPDETAESAAAPADSADVKEEAETSPEAPAEEEEEVKKEVEESPILEDEDSSSAVMTAQAQSSKANIRITITSQVEKLERQDSVVSNSSSSSAAVQESEFDPEAVVQEAKVDVEQMEELKPRLKGRKLTEFPPQCRGNELSGLCSIM